MKASISLALRISTAATDSQGTQALGDARMQVQLLGPDHGE